MKRSIIAVAVLLLLLASATYANPPRAPRRTRPARFWASLLCWLGHNQHHDHGRLTPKPVYGHLPPGHRGRAQYGPGRHFGWERGRHNGWNRNEPPRGRKPDHGSRREREQEHGRGGGRG